MLTQITFDEYNWEIDYASIRKKTFIKVKDPSKLRNLRSELTLMLDMCDQCPFRETRNDVRQPECWTCKQDFGWGPHRTAMEQRMNNIEWLTSKVRTKKTKH